jgi:hypothetical protein
VLPKNVPDVYFQPFQPLDAVSVIIVWRFIASQAGESWGPSRISFGFLLIPGHDVASECQMLL